MDIRLFKFLILFVVELVLGGLLLLENRFLFSFVSLRVALLLIFSTKIAMISFPVIAILPEDNWVWLVEEDPRGRKITLRSKAAKHLHLSMLYFMLLGYPCFLICLSLFFGKWVEKYRFPPALALIACGILFGAFCAYQNFRNVRRYDSLFAVAWDRKAAFVEIFVGVKVARNTKLFYKGFALLATVVFFAGSVLATPIYYKWIAPIGNIQDREKFIVLQTIYCTLLAFSVWAVSMYVWFQMFFSKKLEAWVREKR